MGSGPAQAWGAPLTPLTLACGNSSIRPADQLEQPFFYTAVVKTHQTDKFNLQEKNVNIVQYDTSAHRRKIE